MIKMYGKHRYTLAGTYKEKKPAIDLIKAIRSINRGSTVLPRWYARLEKVPDHRYSPPRTFYRVWQREEPEPKRRK